MFFQSFVMYFRGSLHAPRQHDAVARVLPPRAHESWAMRFAGCAARAHFLVAPSLEPMTAANAVELPRLDRARRFVVNPLRRAGKMVARAALRVAYLGSPLTPTGYAILAMTIAAVALVAMLSTSPVGNELDRALRLSWWFS